MNENCVFAGPSLRSARDLTGIDCFGPIAMGGVFRAVDAGYARIGIVDGMFGNVPSVWHKEILFALSEGVEVVGAASMGALRAVELAGLGMRGLGHIYRMFRCGVWTDDDEVAVLHAPAELAFKPLSDAMANIRFTLRRLSRRAWIDRDVEVALVARMKAKHFSARTRDALHEEAERVVGASAAAGLIGSYEQEYVDAKAKDAAMLVEYLSRAAPAERPGHVPEFLSTSHWRRQFEDAVADIPPLR